MRKLASIQRVLEISPIPDADKIDVCLVLGWRCIVQKGKFKVGDLVIYIEPDSMLPFNPWTGEDLKEKPMRLRIVKMKKQVSQGLVLSVDTPLLTGVTLEEGLDISDILGITKYEPSALPAALSGMARGVFPPFLVKTDETRIQAYPGILLKYANIPFVVTEKLDGMSTTYYWKDKVFGACSRNLDLEPSSGSAQWTVATRLGIEAKLAEASEKMGVELAVQGELMGPGIQSNKLALPLPTFYAFNLLDITNRCFFDHQRFVDWCDGYNVPHVPLMLAAGTVLLRDHTVDSLVKLVTVKSVINPKVWAEGGVFRPTAERRDEDLGRLSFKVINQEFLLTYKE